MIICGYLIVSDEYIEKLEYNSYSQMYINSDDADKLENEINEYVKNKDIENLSISNYDEMVKSNNALVLVISIFLYGFIAVITAIRNNKYI